MLKCLNIVSPGFRCLKYRTFGMSAQLLAKEAVEKIKNSNPYYEKYAQKIAKLQETAPEEFLQRVKVANPIKEGKSQSTRTYAELLNPKTPKSLDNSSETQKKLSDIMKVDLIEDKNAEEIAKIWIEYHKTKDVLAATLSVEQFELLMETAKEHPVFLLPLPRSEGFEFIMLQFAKNTIHFTPLLAYQVHGENAPECLTLVHYTETRPKGVILMRGEYDKQVLTGQEAQCLANELQMFYCKSDKKKRQLLATFTKRPGEFKHMDLIKEVENIEII